MRLPCEWIMSPQDRSAQQTVKLPVDSQPLTGRIAPCNVSVRVSFAQRMKMSSLVPGQEERRQAEPGPVSQLHGPVQSLKRVCFAIPWSSSGCLKFWRPSKSLGRMEAIFGPSFQNYSSESQDND